MRVRLAHHFGRESGHRAAERRGAAAGEASHGNIEASPEEMHRTAFTDEPSAKLLQHLVDPEQCRPEPMCIFGVV